MPLQNEHVARQQNPGKSVRIRRQNDKFGPGIDALFGLKEDGKTELQSIHFDADRFTPMQARKWLKEHGHKAALEEATKKEYSPEDLQAFFDAAHRTLPRYLLDELHKSAPDGPQWRAQEPAKPIAKLYEDGDDPGVMIAYLLPEPIAHRLAVEGGLEPSDMHITLAYLGRMSEVGTHNLGRATELLSNLTGCSPALRGKINGLGLFLGEDEDVAVALADVPDLGSFREMLVRALDEAAIPVSHAHGFTPHVTVKYLTSGEQLPHIDLEAIEFTIDRLHLCAGKNTRIACPMAGVPPEIRTMGPVQMDPSVGSVHVEAPLNWERPFDLRKIDQDLQVVWGVVLEPETEDTQGDVISKEDIQSAAHGFLLKHRIIGKRHRGAIDAAPVESYIAPLDFELEGQTVKAGSWVLAGKIFDEEAWEAVKEGRFQSWSVGGRGVRTPEAA